MQAEVNMMPGKGEIRLTDSWRWMKESALTGMSYIRSVSDEYSLAGGYLYRL